MTLESRCAEAAERLTSAEFLRIFTDDDADGLAAAGVLTVALDRAGVPFHLTAERVPAEGYDQLEAHDALVLLDQGAGELDELSRHPGEVTVLDHHVVEGRAPHALHVNPHAEGYDGTNECCTSTLALLVALQMDPTNADLAPLACAGIVGDRQHVPEVTSVNANVLERAADRGTLTVERGPPFEPTRPLGEALTASVDPFVPGLSGRASEARAFLEGLGLDPGATPRGLDANEARRLVSGLVSHLIAHDVEPRACEEVAGQRFTGTVAGRTLTAGRLSAMLNALAREETPGVAIALAHGDAEALAEATQRVEAYQEDLLKGLLALERDPPEAREAIQVFDAVDPDLVGAHCGLGMTYLFDKARPTLGCKTSDGHLKVSARATQELVEDGVNLAEALSTAADEAGGAGGGHPIAAGARVPLAEREVLLARVDEIVGGQRG